MLTARADIITLRFSAREQKRTVLFITLLLLRFFRVLNTIKMFYCGFTRHLDRVTKKQGIFKGLQRAFIFTRNDLSSSVEIIGQIVLFWHWYKWWHRFSVGQHNIWHTIMEMSLKIILFGRLGVCHYHLLEAGILARTILQGRHRRWHWTLNFQSGDCSWTFANGLQNQLVHKMGLFNWKPNSFWNYFSDGLT